MYDEHEELLRELVSYCMDNPCLSEPMDYESDDLRLEYYIESYETLTVDELKQELESLGGL